MLTKKPWLNLNFDLRTKIVPSAYTSLSTYFRVQINFSHIFNCPNPSRDPLVRQWMHLLNRLGDKQHPCLTPLPILSIHVLLWSSYTWTLWSTYSLLNCLLLHQLISLFCGIYINFIHFTRLDAFSKAITQIHGSYMSEVCSDFLLNSPVASLAPVHLLHPNWSFPITPSIFFSLLLPGILITVFAAWAVRLMAQCSLHFAAFGFFKAIIVTSEILGPLSSFIYVADQLCH